MRLLLGSADYQSPFWITFKQTLALGGHVKRGEKSTPVIYYKILEKRDEAGNIDACERTAGPDRVPFVRWTNVFNLDQTEGIPGALSDQREPERLPSRSKKQLRSLRMPGFAPSTTRLRRHLFTLG